MNRFPHSQSRPGRDAGRGARIRFGTEDIVRLPQRWSDRFIDLEVEGFAGFERFDVPVELQGFKQRPWTPVGQLREFSVGNVPLDVAVP